MKEETLKQKIEEILTHERADNYGFTESHPCLPSEIAIVTAIKKVCESIIGQDEHFVHDMQTSLCMCHKEEQLYKAVQNRNRVRAEIRERLAKELL